MADVDGMDRAEVDTFRRAFMGLTGHDSFPWQERLYQAWSTERIPPFSSCDLPTGLGKTSVIAVWLITLALNESKRRPPRRLVYVVNRRTVVDQATREVEKLRDSLGKANLVVPLRQLCATADGHPLAISTLRGQHADNGEWFMDPTRPAIICGTVDMIGSRLLFGGYRIGYKSRPLHAGFLAQDCLLVHDESHLEPAFQSLIETIRAEQEREEGRAAKQGAAQNGWSGLRVMALSATARGTGDAVAAAPSPFGLTDEERNPPEPVPDPPEKPIHQVWRRLKATKQLSMHQVDDKKTPDKVADLAAKHRDSGATVLVYLRKVEEALRVADTLRKELEKAGVPQHVQTLTGTMRGQEREQLLASDAVFARFMPESSRPAAAERVVGTAYLVCTSAGEVGVDISADHMVCDLSTFDSMAQRFGRVNRYGRFDDTRIDVVHPKEFGKKQKGSEERKLTEMDERRRSTLDLLKQLKGDASPLALSGLNAEARLSAFAPPPTIPPATDILFDAWAMTTIRGDMPGRPPVAPYLHGLAEWEPPRTKVAWREEVDAVTPELLQYFGEEFPRSLLDDYPLKPHELLSDTSERVLRKLQQLAAEHPHARAWLIDGQGEAMVCELACIATPDATKKKDREPLLRTIGEATVLLPPSIGGLTAQGTLDGKTPPEEGPSAGLDVADLWIGEEGKPRRKRMFSEASQPRGTPEAMTLIRTIDVNPLAEEFATREEAEQPAGLEAEDQAEHEATAESRRYWHWFARPRGAENATKASPKPVVWREHIDDVAGWAERITERLGLAEHLKQTLVLAARWHDLGKKRELWQRSIGNPDPTQWHAKGGKPRGETPWRPRRFGEYRHEFGSLLDATDSNQAFAEELRLLSEETRDIVLHLIAAHHGYARPHFPPEATVDPNHPQSASDAAALEVPRRYARLQRRFGRWGLAYLESLLRAADWAASANPAASSAAGEGDEQ